MTALAVVCCVALATTGVALLVAAQRHADQLRHVLASVEAERHAWSRERNELLTRIQHPHLVPAPLPVAPLGESSGGDESSADPYNDEFHLVGKILSGPVNDDGTPVREAA